MSTALHEPPSVRTTRLSALVSAEEAEVIARRAAAAGLSVSAYLRAQALGQTGTAEDDALLQRVDDLIARMEGDLDAAIAQMGATLARLDGR
jgi:Mobilization protein NikA